jgi:hypothetical protein
MQFGARVRLLIGLFVIAMASGCTANQLRRHTVNQAATIHDIYRQQVLDNLAMFVHNRNACPYFALIGQGTSTLTDTATLANTNGWMRNAANDLLFASAGFNPSAMRQQQGSWQTYAVNDSVKLNVMQCIYREAVNACLGGPEDSCQDCTNLYYAYFNIQPPASINPSSIPYLGGPSNNPTDIANGSVSAGKLTSPAVASSHSIETDVPFTKNDEFKGFTLHIGYDNILVAGSNGGTSATDKKTTLFLASPLPIAYPVPTAFTLTMSSRPPIRGIVTPDCLSFRQCWFCCGPKLPKHCDKHCMPHGSYCGTHVWVPQEGIDQLTKLTLLILDVAYYDPPQAGTQTVTTQKTQGTPGPKTSKAAELLRSMSDRTLTPQERDLKMMQVLHELVESQGTGAETSTTTTTVTPSSRQPTQFQPGVLNLQQSLNLLPPRQ